MGRILITGSEGNIGKRLIPYLKNKNHSVMRLDIRQRFGNDYVLCDILNLSDAEERIRAFSPDTVIHLAAMVSRITCEASPHIAVSTNIIGTVNMAMLAKRIGAKFVNISTSEVYGNQDCLLDEGVEPRPNNYYGLTKYLAEKNLEYFARDINYVTIRPFMCYDEHEDMGENRSAMIRFAECVVLGNQIPVHIGAIRSWLHMDDAVAIIEEIATTNLPNGLVVNMGNSDFVPIEKIAERMCEIVGASKTLIKGIALPDKMTLKKIASFSVQKKYISHQPKIMVMDGLQRVVETMQSRLA